MSLLEINQTLTFTLFLEKIMKIKYDDLWQRCEERFMNLEPNQITGKNLSVLAALFGKDKRGSLPFWSVVNQNFMSLSNDLTLRDFIQITQAFCKRDIIDKEKFCNLILECYSQYEDKDFTELDVAQILSTARYQHIGWNQSPLAKEFWDESALVLEDLLTMQNIGKSSFVVILNSVRYDLFRRHNPNLWRLFDNTLVKLYEEIKRDKESSFIVLTVYIHQLY